MRVVHLSSESIRFDQQRGYVITRRNGNIDIVREAKLCAEQPDQIAYAKPDGTVEWTYSTQKKYPTLTSVSACKLIER